MTGAEFEAEIRAAGFSQVRFAKVMGVHRTTIAARCVPDYEVEPHWRFALAGLIASKAMGEVARLVDDLDQDGR